MATTPVKVRGGGYGLDAELAQRAADKYDPEMELEAREWIETITGESIGEDFGEGLKNGVILCELVNIIHPSIVKRIEKKSTMPFRLMENVSAFLKACRVMGVNEFDLFETVDLFEGKDLGLVVRCIHALGRAVQKNYPTFQGPTLGVKESSKNERQFSTEVLAEARNVPALLNLGSMRTMERLEVSRANDVTFGADMGRAMNRAPPPPPPPSASKVEMLARARAEPSSPEKFEQRSVSSLTKPVSADEQATNDRATNETLKGLSEAISNASIRNGDRQDSTTPKQSPSPSAHRSPGSAGLSPLKIDALSPMEEAQEWIEAVLNEKLLASFGDSLKDGIILCTLMNTIQPGLVGRIQTSRMPFKQMENITAFLKACRVVGVAEFDLFETVDLFELKNIDLVVKCLHALGRAVQKNCPEFTGPTLGVKESTVNKRRFSPAQLQEAAGAVPLLAEGSSRVMERRDFDRSASVTFGRDAAMSGLERKHSDVGEQSPERKLSVGIVPRPSDTTTTSNSLLPPSLESEADTSEGAATPPKERARSTSKTSQQLPTRTVWTS